MNSIHSASFRANMPLIPRHHAARPIVGWRLPGGHASLRSGGGATAWARFDK
jgi:hypothetical protein